MLATSVGGGRRVSPVEWGVVECTDGTHRRVYLRHSFMVASSLGIHGQIRESEGKLTLSPLRVCPVEGRVGYKVVGDSFLLEEGRDERVEKEGEDEEVWRYSCLARFYQCLGMPSEGCESEILKLLNRMRERRDRSERVNGKKRKGQRPLRFDRELKKLEWLVNYGGLEGDRGVYGPIVKVEREDFLSELGAIRGLWNESWCVAGDFNMIRFPSERSRGGRMSSTMRMLAKVLANKMKGVLAKIFSVGEWKPYWFFPELKGFKARRPFSPYLFVVVMEAFSCLLKRAVVGGYLTPWLVWGRRGEGAQISHLLFADDMLIFCEAKEEQLTYLCWLLMWFKAMSGLRANLEKSELIQVGRVENVEEVG
ncbi:hypothetical protein CK203_085969 [Vitis vinifera]|uniref:Reverse transcriptase domain-containing protein n=1 Tax=Vitis vinifera TaxID=29760 RepID=A0A438DVK4_VITVI|nr:hypothetical protein CK203_085969 [Vitis vinifera]